MAEDKYNSSGLRCEIVNNFNNTERCEVVMYCKHCHVDDVGRVEGDDVDTVSTRHCQYHEVVREYCYDGDLDM